VTQNNDTLGAEPVSRKDAAQSHSAVSNNGNCRAFADARTDSRMVPGPHHVGEGQYSLEQSGIIFDTLGQNHQIGVGIRGANYFTLAPVVFHSPETCVNA
jgi:hypothetical protein